MPREVTHDRYHHLSYPDALVDHRERDAVKQDRRVLADGHEDAGLGERQRLLGGAAVLDRRLDGDADLTGDDEGLAHLGLGVAEALFSRAGYLLLQPLRLLLLVADQLSCGLLDDSGGVLDRAMGLILVHNGSL